MTDVPATRGLLISVGGSPNPVAFSINHHRPEKVIFFASRDSRPEIETKVRPLTTHRWADQEIITTPDHQDLMTCLDVLSEELPRKLGLLGLAVGDLVVDYTGSTKTMSAALVLATVNAPVRYSYVGGKVDAKEVRSKDGLGIVLDGSEAVLMSPNPWDVLAVDLRRRLARQFNAGHFAEARETATEAAGKVSERWRGLYEPLGILCDAYQYWSGFDYSKARNTLRQAYAKLKGYLDAAHLPGLSPFMDSVKTDLDRLELLLPAFQDLQGGRTPDSEAVRALIIDLVANAVRTKELAARPDDGVVRLYSAIEKLAKTELSCLGINNSAARPEQIPESLREEFVGRYTDADSGTLKFGLDASYRVLAALGAPVGERYRAREVELRGLLEQRNNSILVHGWKPIRSEVFNGMLAITLDFLGLTMDKLPDLPTLPSA